MSAVQTLESAVACHAMKSLVLGDMLEQSLILVFFHDEAMLGLGKLSLANVFLEVRSALLITSQQFAYFLTNFGVNRSNSPTIS